MLNYSLFAITERDMMSEITSMNDRRSARGARYYGETFITWRDVSDSFMNSQEDDNSNSEYSVKLE